MYTRSMYTSTCILEVQNYMYTTSTKSYTDMNYIRVGVPSDKGRRIGLGWDTQEGFTHICNVLFKKITRNEHSKNVEVNKARGWVCGCSSSLYTSANMRCFLYKENGNVSELSKSDSHACGTLVFMLSEEVHTEPESSTRESSTASLLSHPASLP